MVTTKGGCVVLTINFVTSSKNVVVKILKKFYPIDRVKEMVEKGEIREDLYNNGYNFSPPPGDNESFNDFLEELEARKELELQNINESGSTNGVWLQYKILRASKG